EPGSGERAAAARPEQPAGPEPAGPAEPEEPARAPVPVPGAEGPSRWAGWAGSRRRSSTTPGRPSRGPPGSAGTAPRPAIRWRRNRPVPRGVQVRRAEPFDPARQLARVTQKTRRTSSENLLPKI